MTRPDTGGGTNDTDTGAPSIDDELLSRDAVAARLGIAPESVRSTMRRAGIPEVRGYPRRQVDALQRPGRGRRADTSGAAE